jgi:hypothetical protein
MKYTDYQVRAIVVIALSIISSACGGGSVGSSSSRIDGTVAGISPPNTWPQVGGSNVQDAAATYGTQGTTSTTDFPGVQQAVVTWTDSSANPRLLGGEDIDANGTAGVLNDHWKYDPATGQRTPVRGSSSGKVVAVYGTRGTSRRKYMRSAGGFWRDASGNLWLLGGLGYGSAGNGGN